MDNVCIRQAKQGKGVFALHKHAKGEIIMRFCGQILEGDHLPEPYDSVDDHYVQIGPNTFMGPSGKEDDYVNHSCDPNAGLIISEDAVTLVAIKPIDVGDEITWDYSTTMSGDDWQMQCECGSPQCRGIVNNFETLPKQLQEKYTKLGVVPYYAQLAVT